MFFSANERLKLYLIVRGLSGGAMVMGKLPVPGRTTNLEKSQGPTVLAVGAGGGGLDIFFFLSRLSFLSSYSLSLGDGPI